MRGQRMNALTRSLRSSLSLRLQHIRLIPALQHGEHVVASAFGIRQNVAALLGVDACNAKSAKRSAEVIDMQGCVVSPTRGYSGVVMPWELRVREQLSMPWLHPRQEWPSSRLSSVQIWCPS